MSMQGRDPHSADRSVVPSDHRLSQTALQPWQDYDELILQAANGPLELGTFTPSAFERFLAKMEELQSVVSQLPPLDRDAAASGDPHGKD